jgi:uncharacterized phage protein (TIGR02218 family)
MKSISAGLKTAIAEGTTTLARLFYIVTTSGNVYRFTDHDSDIFYNEISIIPPAIQHQWHASSGVSVSSIVTTSTNSQATTQVRVVYTSGFIEELACIRGEFDGASMRVLFLDWSDLSLGHATLFEGVLGSFQNSFKGYGFFELFNKFAQLRRPLGAVYSPECRADLGDARCGVDINALSNLASVTAVTSRSAFTVSATSGAATKYYEQGVVVFTSGANSGRSVEILTDPSASTTRAIRLVLPLPADIEVGDTLTLYAGCDKRIETCQTKFGNAINFQGEPAVPGALFASGYPI